MNNWQTQCVENATKGPEGRQSIRCWCLLMLFSNDRIICYGSFDSSLILSPFLSHSLKTGTHVASRGNNSKTSVGGGGTTANQSGGPQGICHSDLPLWSWELKKWYYRGSRGSATWFSGPSWGKGSQGVEQTTTWENSRVYMWNGRVGGRSFVRVGTG